MVRPLKIAYFICLVFFSSSLITAAQEEGEPPALRDRIFFGGNFGLQFGSITNIELSPLIGYRITPATSAGAGIRYEYYRNARVPGSIYETNIYGGSAFIRQMLFKNLGERINIGITSNIFAQGEYEVLSLDSRYFGLASGSEGGRYLAHSVLVGGGIFQPMGERGGFLLTALWNLNESYKSPYTNPVIRIGFIF